MTSYAFPVPDLARSSGLTKRELFAVMMLQAMLSRRDISDLREHEGLDFVKYAVKAADALITELE